MKSLSFFELKNFAQWFQSETEGAQLQEVWTNGQTLVLHFYRHQDLYLCIDTLPNEPQVVVLADRPPLEKKQKPTAIFLNAHGKNLRLDRAWVQADMGRVLFLSLQGSERSCELEIRLIPKAFNILVRAGSKKISWAKPKELKVSQNPEMEVSSPQDWRAVGRLWGEEKFKRRMVAQESKGSDPRLKALDKKRKALVEIELKIKSDGALPWSKLGEALKISTSLPEELKEFYDSKKSRSWNIENAFRQDKILKKKRLGTLQRVEILKAEIFKLENDLETNPRPLTNPTENSKGRQILQKSESKGRRLPLEEGVEAVIGKSAKDNLLILRHAQAWDLWLHLKDYPGAHAIILRPRNKQVSREAIQKVAEWLMKESLSKEEVRFGGKYEVVVVETRHVRPIKGDQLGRVTYHHPQTYSFASKT